MRNLEQLSMMSSLVLNSKLCGRFTSKLIFSYDFYLVAQAVRQGTVSPVCYQIIEDTGVGLKADQYQILTYRLTHMYFNWQGTIRVPAHCQLAHKKAFLTGQSLHKPAHRDLCYKQYFL